MFRLPFKVYGAVITFKKIKYKKMTEIVFLKFEVFFLNHPSTRHIKYKRIDFAPCCKSITANKLP